jgi:hypothetical protein
MSKTLKRPMFRRGGTVNDGIMTGLTDRVKAQDGYSGLDVDRARLESMAISNIMNELAPIPKTKLPIGQFGLDIATGTPVGEALKSSYGAFTKADDARRLALAKRKQAAVSTALGSQMSKKTGSKIALEKMIDLSIKSGEFPDTPQGRAAAFKKYSLSASDIERGSTRDQISERFRVFYSGTGGTESEAEYDILKRQGKLGIKGTDFGKKDLLIKADREDIEDNENFGPGDGFVDIGSGKVFILKPGGDKDDFTSNSYDIIDLKSLY